MNWTHYDTNKDGWKAYRTNVGYPVAKVHERGDQYYHHWFVMEDGNTQYASGYTSTVHEAMEAAQFHLKKLLTERYGNWSE